ncbi:hypothetical protein [Luteibacter sp.]|uniref:hypothetical protein n=1 Tax=Luteibacter sp. TaxID=1886636 RepID=UPI003F7F2883
MSRKFDVDKAIVGLTSFDIRFVNDNRFDAARPMGNVAKDLVNGVAKACFVGLFDEVKEVLPRSIEWLRYEIASQESFGSTTEYHSSLLNQALALALWMQSGSFDESVWDSALRIDQAVISVSTKVYSPKDLVSARLDHVMPIAVLAGRYDAAIAEFESLPDAVTSKAKSVSPRE